MKIYAGIFAFCCLVGMCFPGCSQSKQETEPQTLAQGIPRLTLSLQHLDFEAGQLEMLLDVTNQGEHPLTITRLQEGRIEACGLWKGWYVEVFDQDERFFGPMCGREAEALIGKDDLIQLRPGEHFSVSIHLGEWRLANVGATEERQFYQPLALLQESGVYDITVRLSFYTDMLIGSPPPVSWTGEVFSNTVQVAIHYQDNPLPKRLSYPERAIEKSYICQCRVDCDLTSPGNLCLQNPVDQRSLIATAEANHYRDAMALARKRAIMLLRGVPKHYQPCFCSDQDGPYGGDDYPDL